MAVCPNISHPDWELSVRLFGLDNTLYFYDQLEQVPNKYQLSMLYKQRKGIELTDLNNPYVWDIEDSEDLIARWRTDETGKRVPVKRAFTTYKAAALVKEFRQKYPDANFSTYKVDTPSRSNTRIRVSVPFDTSTPLYEQRAVKKERTIEEVISQYKYVKDNGDLSVKLILREILDKSENNLIKDLAADVFARPKDLDEIIININQLEGKHLGTYESLWDKKPDLKLSDAKLRDVEHFYEVFMHEVMHHYTYPKLNSYQRGKNITTRIGALHEDIYQDDLDNINVIQEVADVLSSFEGTEVYYGFTKEKNGQVDIHEFVSEYMTDMSFRDYVNDLLYQNELDVNLPGLIGKTFFDKLDAGDDFLTASERKDFENKKKIMLDTFPWVKKVIEDVNIVNAGQLEEKGTIIRVNPLKMSKDVLGHEFGHLLIDLMGGLDNPLIKSALNQLQDTPLANRIKEAYKDKTETVINKEIVAEAIGKETEKIFDKEEQRNKFERLLVRIFERIKKLLGIDSNSVRKLANMVLGKEEFEKKGEVVESIYEQRLPDYITKAEEKAKAETKEKEKKVPQPEYLERVRGMEDVMGELRNKIVDKLRTKIQIYERTGDDVQVQNLKRRLEDIEFDESKMNALRSYIMLASSQTSAIYRQFERAKKAYKEGDKKALTAKMLQRWADYVSAFDILDSVELAIIDHFGREDYEKSGLLKATRSYIQSAISRKNEIKGFLESEGTELVAKWLEPYVTRITAEYKLIYEREWRKLPRDTRPSKEAYINSKVSENKELIETNTRHVIRAELKKGEFDIGYAYRMGETILDSDDIVIGAMAKAFALAMDRARRQGIEMKDKIVDKLRKLEQFNPQTAFKSAESFYDFMIEKDKNGKYTNKMVGKYRSEFWDAYEQMKDETEQKLQDTLEGIRKRKNIDSKRRQELIRIAQEARDDARKQWRNRHAPIDTAKMKEAKLAFIEGLLDDDLLTSEEYDDVLRIVNNPKYIPIEDALKSKPDVAAMIEKWGQENAWNFRNPTEEWASPQYEKLQQLRKKNPNDPRIEFYDLIVEIKELGDKYLPFRYRLHQSLPFMPKSAVDRLKSGQGMYNTAKAAASDSFVAKWFDIERGQLDESGQVLELIDENNNPKMFLPVYYTPKKGATPEEQKKIVEDQSFDIATIFYNWYKMAVEYKEKNEILAEMELTRHLIENREVTKLDSKDNPILNANDKLKNRHLTKTGMQSMVAAQLNDWFEAVVYGKTIKDEGTFTMFGREFDKAKTIDKLNKYTAYNLLGLNLMQGVANKALGEVMQIAEMFAGEHYSVKDYRKAVKQYNTNLGGILGDVGKRKPDNIINLLLERFDVLHDYSDPENFQKSTKFRQLMQSNTAFFLAKAGEHSMQAKAMLAILNGMNATDRNGEILKNADGSNMSLFDAFTVKDGKLILNEKVDISEERLDIIGHTMKRILSRMHGEYSDIGRVALQRSALGRMAYMFRKFMIQGWKRRMELSKRKNDDGSRAFKYNEVGEFFTEGAYRSTARFLRNMAKDWNLFKMEMWSKNWDELTSVEIANIRRTVTEAIALVLIWTMANILIHMEGDDDDDNILLAHGIYQLLRLKSELAFFINPLEAMKILRSPAASMSVIENTGRALALLNPFNPQIGERFERGPWKDHLKIEKYATNAVPMYRQGKRILDIENQLNWFK